MRNMSKWRHIVVVSMIWTTTLALLLSACGSANLSGSAGMEGEPPTDTLEPTDEIATLPPVEPPPTNTPEPTDVIATLPPLEISSSTPTATATQQPHLGMGFSCKANSNALFKITNSGGAMPSPGTYTVTNPNNGTSTTSNFQLAANGQTSFTAVGNAIVTMQYAGQTLQATGACTPPPTRTRTPSPTRTPTKTRTPTP